MPFARPTLTALRDQAFSDVMTRAGDLLSRSILGALAWAQAGLASLHYGFLDRIAEESVPWTATEERLAAWAALKGITATPAVAATGNALFSGTPGATIPAGASVTRSDGTSYTVTTGGTVGGDSTVTVAIVADVAGAAGNAPIGAALTLGGSPGVNSSGIVSFDVTGGADAENDDALRARMLLRYAAPPQGGSGQDYEQWALAVPGVTRAWVAPNGAGAGTVVLYHMRDLTTGFPVGTDGVAAAEQRAAAATGDQLAVADAIFPLRPVTALVYSCAPVAYSVDVTIADLYPNTPEMQAAVMSALAGAFFRAGSVAGTAWPVASAGSVNGKMFPSDLADALAAVPGLVRYTLAAPSASFTAPAGGLPTLGGVTFA